MRARSWRGRTADDSLIGVVTGDDVLDRIPGWIEEGLDLSHLETGEPIAGVAGRLVAANVYLGARPIAAGSARGRGSSSPGGSPTPR